MTADPAAVLRTNPALALIGEESLTALVARAQRVGLEVGQRLFCEGDRGATLYLLLSGSVELFTRRGGGVLCLGSAGPGGVVGDMALLDPGRRSATATVSEAGEALVLLEDDLDDLLWEESAGFLLAMQHLLEGRLALTLGSIELLLSHAGASGVNVDDLEREAWSMLHGACR